VSQPGISPRVRSWGRRQLYSLLSSLGNLLDHRIGTLMTILVIAIALVLPLGLFVTLQNLQTVDLQQDEWSAITVFLTPDATHASASELARQINQSVTSQVDLISPEQGLEEFKQASGFGAALDVLDSNPLPWVLQVKPVVTDSAPMRNVVADLQAWLEEQSLVDSVLVDFKWLQRLSGLLNLGDAFVSILSVMFALAVVVVIANTIRLDVASRADEIEVLSLVGASNGFIRQPFLYSGFWYGLLGAILALAMLAIALDYLGEPLADLVDAYGNAFLLQGLGFTDSLLVLLSGSILGFLGAWISVERYLRLLRRGERLRRL